MICCSSWSYARVMLTGKTSFEGECDSVLIFLKSEPFAQSLKKALETSGYRGIAVTSESVALTEANANVPSLIILDRQSGAVANFRRMSKFRTVPIVAVEGENISFNTHVV